MTIRWGTAARPKQGQTVSGDAYLVLEQEHSSLAMLVDGLGGGEEAAHAASYAVRTVKEHAERPLKEIMEHCHRQLHGTRGAVMGLLRLEYSKRQATFVGVGNIGIYVVSSQSIKPISRNGILGHRQLPSLLELHYQYDAGDLFVLFSDGVSTRFISEASQIQRQSTPEELASTILEQYGKSNDDATVLVLAVTD